MPGARLADRASPIDGASGGARRRPSAASKRRRADAVGAASRAGLGRRVARQRRRRRVARRGAPGRRRGRSASSVGRRARAVERVGRQRRRRAGRGGPAARTPTSDRARTGSGGTPRGRSADRACAGSAGVRLPAYPGPVASHMAEPHTRASCSSTTSSRSRRCSPIPLRKDGYEVVQAVRRPRGARALRRATVRPRRARRDAAAARRARGLPPPARRSDGADHHADRQGGGDRQGPRPRARRRRLHHQAVLDARVPQPREGGAAPRGHGPRDAGRATSAPLEVHELRIDPAKRAVAVARRGRSRRPSSSSRSCSRSRASPGRVFTRDMLLTRIWGDTAYRDPRTIDVHIRHLREKLERDPRSPSTSSPCAASATASATRTS